MEVFARLRDVVVTDANPTTIHRKVSHGRTVTGEDATRVSSHHPPCKISTADQNGCSADVCAR